MSDLEKNGPTPERPTYTKIQHDDGRATKLWFIVCDEGWREQIVCSQMYEWAADWLIDQIQGKPYSSGESNAASKYVSLR